MNYEEAVKIWASKKLGMPVQRIQCVEICIRHRHGADDAGAEVYYVDRDDDARWGFISLQYAPLADLVAEILEPS